MRVTSGASPKSLPRTSSMSAAIGSFLQNHQDQGPLCTRYSFLEQKTCVCITSGVSVVPKKCVTGSFLEKHQDQGLLLCCANHMCVHYCIANYLITIKVGSRSKFVILILNCNLSLNVDAFLRPHKHLPQRGCSRFKKWRCILCPLSS